MTRYSATEVVAVTGGLSRDDLERYVDEGLVRPRWGEGEQPFDDYDLARVRLVCRLQDDLALDGGAVPVVLSLLDQIHGLRRQMRLLVTALAAEPDDVRQRIEATLRTIAG